MFQMHEVLKLIIFLICAYLPYFFIVRPINDLIFIAVSKIGKRVFLYVGNYLLWIFAWCGIAMLLAKII